MAKKSASESAGPVSHPDLYPYPESLPASLWPHVIDLLRGKFPDPKEAAHYGWHAAGYGLFMWAGQEPPVVQGAPQLTPAQAADLLEVHMKGVVGSQALPPIPWRQIALLVLQVLQQILSA